MPSILITGASSGIGEATVKWFLAKGWQVFATMRQPDKPVFTAHPNLKLLKLDVTDPQSVSQAIDQARQLIPRLDVLLNNAGYGLVGPLELATAAQITQQFDTNVFGLIRVTQAVLPWMREQQGGCIINVASIGGRTAFPYYSLYHGTKWAVEGLSESLWYELGRLGIRVKLVEPGPIKTPFYARSMTVTGQPGVPNAYQPHSDMALAQLSAFGDKAPGPEVVARTVWQAAQDASSKLRYPVNSMGSLWLRRLLPEGLYRWAVKKITRF
jgi:NAD(P)-dependent dehydrogenase (short-subunit alcohol dehydrogenase family)